MTLLELPGLHQSCGTAQIPVQNPATRSGENVGERPEKSGLMQMVQQAVADNQIGTSEQLRQITPLQILKRGLLPAHREASGGSALSRNRQHGSGPVHPNKLSGGMRCRQRQGDVAWSATEVDEQRSFRQCRGPRQQGLDQGEGAAISVAEIRLRISLHLLRIVHEFRLANTLHWMEAEGTSLGRTLLMVENGPC